MKEKDKKMNKKICTDKIPILYNLRGNQKAKT